jgi:hypothetical protein
MAAAAWQLLDNGVGQIEELERELSFEWIGETHPRPRGIRRSFWSVRLGVRSCAARVIRGRLDAAIGLGYDNLVRLRLRWTGLRAAAFPRQPRGRNCSSHELRPPCPYQSAVAIVHERLSQ